MTPIYDDIVRQHGTNPAPDHATDGIECITRDPTEPAPPASLAVCDNRPVHLACSVHCPTGEGACGGHPVCDPCYRLGVETGFIRPPLDQHRRAER